ncbi:MAG TPA: hypothetical protein VEK79_10410 [Thermoanaerobaculia bacterium]|nr:hypothetical protein [Thermoanaerobaculia bacterium]
MSAELDAVFLELRRELFLEIAGVCESLVAIKLLGAQRRRSGDRTRAPHRPLFGPNAICRMPIWSGATQVMTHARRNSSGETTSSSLKRSEMSPPPRNGIDGSLIGKPALKRGARVALSNMVSRFLDGLPQFYSPP